MSTIEKIDCALCSRHLERIFNFNEGTSKRERKDSHAQIFCRDCFILIEEECLHWRERYPELVVSDPELFDLGFHKGYGAALMTKGQ